MFAVFAEPFHPGLIFHSNFGRKKTHIIYSVCPNNLQHHRVEPHFAPSFFFFFEIHKPDKLPNGTAISKYYNDSHFRICGEIVMSLFMTLSDSMCLCTTHSDSGLLLVTLGYFW